MRKVLVDTHIALWSLFDTGCLSAKAKKELTDPLSEKFLSYLSVWEVAIKHQAHPEKMGVTPAEFAQMAQEAGYTLLPVALGAILGTEALPYGVEQTTGHKDPFDRLLICQAQSEGMGFITHDASLSGYGMPFLEVV